MIQKTYTVVSPEGLHARPASLLCAEASKYQGAANIEYGGKVNTLKSIMVIMSLGIGHNEQFTIILDGDQEETALSNLEKVLLDNEII